MKVDGLLLVTSFPNTGAPGTGFWGMKLVFDWPLANWDSKFFKSVSNWFNDFASSLLAFWQKVSQPPGKENQTGKTVEATDRSIWLKND